MGNYAFDLDLPDGLEGEEVIRSMFAGAKLEVKRDKMAWKTGNIAIEIECRGKPSGVMITQSDWWFHIIEEADGTIQRVWVASVPMVKRLVEGRRVVRGGDRDEAHPDGVSVLALVPVRELYTPISGLACHPHMW